MDCSDRVAGFLHKFIPIPHSSICNVIYLRFMCVHQRWSCSHHGAAPWSRQRCCRRFWWTLGLLLQNLSKPLQVEYKRPVHTFLCPVRLKQATQHGHIKVCGIACPLAQRDSSRGWQPIRMSKRCMLLFWKCIHILFYLRKKKKTFIWEKL